MVLDADERALFATTLGELTARASGEALDDALESLGWRDALAADRRAAIATLFEAQGRAAASSSALHHVLTSAMGIEPDPGLGAVLPGRLGLPGLARCGSAVAAGGTVDVASLELRPITGIDPELGLVAVTGAESALTGDALAAGRLALASELVG